MLHKLNTEILSHAQSEQYHDFLNSPQVKIEAKIKY